MKTGRAFWIVILLMAVCGLAGILVGEEFYYRSFYFWLGFCLLSAVWTYWGLSGIEVDRMIRQDRVEVGQYILESLDVTNHSRLPKVWVEIIDQSGIGRHRVSRVVTLIGGRRIRSFGASTIAEKRGFFDIGPTILHASDPFGLFSVEKVLPARSKILITPAVVDLFHTGTAEGNLPGGKPVRRRSHEMTSFSSSIREYRPGDPLKRIHWASTARYNDLMVKEFDLEPQMEVAIFLNANGELQWDDDMNVNLGDHLNFTGSRTSHRIARTSIDYLATIGCSLGRHYLLNGNAVGLFSNDQPAVDIPADRSERQEMRFLEAMSTCRGQGDVNYPGSVMTRLSSIPRGSLIWLVSSAGEENLVSLAEALVNRTYQPIVILLLPELINDTGKIEIERAYIMKGIRHVLIPVDGDRRQIQSALSSVMKIN